VDFSVSAAGDSALVVSFPERIDPDINARLAALGDALRLEAPAIVRDAVLGYCSLTVYFDPLRVDAAWLEERIRTCDREMESAEDQPGKDVDVPVCYGGEFGPDLPYVADVCGCSEEDVIRMHTDVTYRVYVVGFVPGFAYMGVVHDRLALPRRASPRTRVPAGSVAIAAGQTGIYPIDTPGGWHLLGRTPVRPFDWRRHPPALFAPGDRVRFRVIDRDNYDALARA
jgi:inhibitor of KinA